MAAQTEARVTIRVDRELKETADILFARLGLNMSTAFNMFLRKAVETKAIPFPVSLGNAGTAGKYSDEEISERFALSAAEDIAEYRAKKLPIAKYDKRKKRAYLEYADGRREYV